MRRLEPVKSVIISASPNGPVVRARIATSIWARFRGLMLKKSLPAGEGLLIDPCTSVHTMFMRFPIDVVFLDRENRVTKVVPALKPLRIAFGNGGKRALELPAGAAAECGIEPGAVLSVDPV